MMRKSEEPCCFGIGTNKSWMETHYCFTLLLVVAIVVALFLCLGCVGRMQCNY